jgi:hypothetical protein
VNQSKNILGGTSIGVNFKTKYIKKDKVSNGNSNVKKKVLHSIKTKSCDKGNSKKCKLDLSNFDIEDADEMDFQLKPNGHKIKCTQFNEKGNSNLGKSWHAECEGNGSVNIVTKGKNRDGEDLIFGSLVSGGDVCRMSPNAVGENEVICIPSTDFPKEKEAYKPSSGKGRDLLDGSLFEKQPEINGT